MSLHNSRNEVKKDDPGLSDKTIPNNKLLTIIKNGEYNNLFNNPLTFLPNTINEIVMPVIPGIDISVLIGRISYHSSTKINGESDDYIYHYSIPLPIGFTTTQCKIFSIYNYYTPDSQSSAGYQTIVFNDQQKLDLPFIVNIDYIITGIKS